MQVEIINPPFFVKPVGYSHMSKITGPAGTMLFLGGICGMDENGAIVDPENIVAQFDRALSNIKQAIEYAGGQVEHVARMRIFTSDMDNYQSHMRELGQVWKKHFGKHYPAMALLGLKQLFDLGAKIEIECEAFLP